MANIKIKSKDGLSHNMKVLIDDVDISDKVRYVHIIQNPLELMEAHISVLVDELDVELPEERVTYIVEEK